MPAARTDPDVAVAALYQFTAFPDPEALRAPLLGVCEAHGIKGTLLLAREGINGTIAGAPESLDAVLAHIRALPGCADLDVKFSAAPAMPFHRMKVRVKREIVTMGEPDIDPTLAVGHYVHPQDWNTLIADPDTLVIDTRNDYEVAVGTFAGAVDPQTPTFRDFPAWFREHRDALLAGKKKVAMFCTGGIRCEKSTSFLRAEGIDEVYHLKGGILKYLEQVPEDKSLWKGECFVFDERVTVRHGLEQGTFQLCRACRRPLDAAALAHPDYADGVSCPACIHERTPEQRAGYAERQRQEALARKRGQLHVGAVRPPKA
ncbi:rhodanese-related sulfurtransferase [Porphyrobacter sp. YT40]|uniref:oxygen-dependent tRNA uridine(34) hydroxylase TrhO n=1 Tax=Porphyrobacter sp. YT40 TaxID=2547601 RepID=UPI0011416EA5|nr:rhodanese-related sulfurtransferase [Porphyrobacter sp. YT40]QDH34504.1 rhodanese-related sulfurtransferase [Porphyrobacter sp. YT40]